jgi:hypothetical protein
VSSCQGQEVKVKSVSHCATFVVVGVWCVVLVGT